MNSENTQKNLAEEIEVMVIVGRVLKTGLEIMESYGKDLYSSGNLSGGSNFYADYELRRKA